MRILSLDGGGARGILTLEVLRHIEESQDAPIGQLFDLVVGSSVGGMIALMLTKPQPVTAHGIQDIFRDLLPEVFAAKTWNLLAPKYDGSVLKRYASEHLSHPLSYHTPVAVTTYDTHTASPRALVSWNAGGEAWTAANAAMATSAAPTYFPPVDNRYIDGGVVANNPSTIAIMCAHELLHKPSDTLALFSVGTGVPAARMFHAESWGQVGWIGKIVDIMMDGTASLQHLLAPSFVSKYLRVQPELPCEIPMDRADPETQTLLCSIGHDAYEANANDIAEFFAASALSEGRRSSLAGQSHAPLDDLSSTGSRQDAHRD